MFSHGCFVTFNATDSDAEILQRHLSRVEKMPYNPKVVKEERETIPYELSEEATATSTKLTVRGGRDENCLLERFAIADGISGSVKLAMVENALDTLTTNFE